MNQRLGWRTFGLADRVAQRENHGPLAAAGHGPDDRGCKVPGVAGSADEDRGAKRLYHLFERGCLGLEFQRREFLQPEGDLSLMSLEVCSSLVDNSARVEEHLALPDFGLRKPLGQQSGSQEASDADPGGA